VEERDVFQSRDALGRFDRVTWNAPFMFFPDDEKEQNLDGHGGDLGIEISLRFLAKLPELLKERATAVLLTSAPIMASGENRLESELRARIEGLGLDVVSSALQAFWDPRLKDFHRSRGIDHFESTILEIRPGSGAYRRTTPTLAQRLVDGARALAYRADAGS
jgi:hypothetical protein